jgi:thiol-disulfide isomerase/thioredoxin
VVEQYEPKKPPELLAKGAQAPELGLLDPEGEEHVLADHEGEVILLDFWGTWCGPCLQAMPSIQKLHERFQDRGVAIFGVSCREPKGADPAGLMKRRGFTYTLLLAGDKVADAYHVTSYPTFYIIGKERPHRARRLGVQRRSRIARRRRAGEGAETRRVNETARRHARGIRRSSTSMSTPRRPRLRTSAPRPRRPSSP